MTSFLIIAGVLVFWFVLTTLVRFERGFVGMTFEMFLRLRMRVWLFYANEAAQQVTAAIAEAFDPVLERTAKAMAEWGAAYEQALHTEIRTMVATVRANQPLVCPSDDEDLYRLHCAVARWDVGLGPGDVPEEYALVERAMA